MNAFTAAEAEGVRRVSELPFGDRLDRLVVAIAEAMPDRPAQRLEIAINLTLEPYRAATIACCSSTKEDIRWILGVLGVPTEAIPGQMLVWRFHK